MKDEEAENERRQHVKGELLCVSAWQCPTDPHHQTAVTDFHVYKLSGSRWKSTSPWQMNEAALAKKQTEWSHGSFFICLHKHGVPGMRHKIPQSIFEFVNSHPWTDKLNRLHVRCATRQIKQIHFSIQAFSRVVINEVSSCIDQPLMQLWIQFLKTNSREPCSTIAAQALMMTFEEMTEVPQRDGIMTDMNSLLGFFLTLFTDIYLVWRHEGNCFA